jgi:hypothetical protein
MKAKPLVARTTPTPGIISLRSVLFMVLLPTRVSRRDVGAAHPWAVRTELRPWKWCTTGLLMAGVAS